MNSHFDLDQLAYFKSPSSKNTEPSFFFYDLETSGINPREDRIMQFAGQRTDLALQPIGEPINLLIRLNDDTLPSPEALMVTKISPLDTLKDGISEVEFCKFISQEIFTPNTISCGYNSIRFDDEHMRYLFWRNFYDPYEWQWKDGRSRWDLLDVVRMVRALRPEGIAWPSQIDPETGKLKAVNKLELLSKINAIKHQKAHDALSDVEALISLAKVLQQKQPQVYQYLFKMRSKNMIKQLVNLNYPKAFVYTSGRYASDFLHTSVAFPIAPSRNGNLLVFNLRHNLDQLLEEERQFRPEKKKNRFGQEYTTRYDFKGAVKEFCFNKCPAVAPLSVLDVLSMEDSIDPVSPHQAGTSGWQKISLSKSQIEQNQKSLLSHPDFIERMRSLYEKADEYPPNIDVEATLYDGFIPKEDHKISQKIRLASINELADLEPNFIDERLPKLLLHYKARNFFNSLSIEEQQIWEDYRQSRIERQSKEFLSSLSNLEALVKQGGKTSEGRLIDPKILKDLRFWYKKVKNGK